MAGLNLMDKTFYVQGVTISFSIWDVGGKSKLIILNKSNKTVEFIWLVISILIANYDIVGDEKRSKDHIPIACKDSVAILFMFDLTSRSTLNRFAIVFCFFVLLFC